MRKLQLTNEIRLWSIIYGLSVIFLILDFSGWKIFRNSARVWNIERVKNFSIFDKFLFIIRWTVSSSFCPCFYHKTEMTKEKSICQKNNQDQYFCNFIMGWPRDNWSCNGSRDCESLPGDFKSRQIYSDGKSDCITHSY